MTEWVVHNAYKKKKQQKNQTKIHVRIEIEKILEL